MADGSLVSTPLEIAAWVSLFGAILLISVPMPKMLNVLSGRWKRADGEVRFLPLRSGHVGVGRAHAGCLARWTVLVWRASSWFVCLRDRPALESKDETRRSSTD